MSSALKKWLAPVAVPAQQTPHATLDNAELLPLVVQMIREGHTVTLPLRGNSMRPFLVHGRDKALLTAVKTLRVGLPVLAEAGAGHYVLHRIVALDGDSVTLLGDGNLATEHCRRNDVKALAAGFYRKGSTVPDLITSWKWRVYSALWMRLTPFRRYLLLLHHALFRSLKVLDS